jgi:dienelactone hydrolase
LLLVILATASACARGDERQETLPGTKLLLNLAEDPAAEMVAGIDRFALSLLAEAAEQRHARHWSQADSKSQNLEYLQQQLGMQYLHTEWSETEGTLLSEPHALVGDELAVEREEPVIRNIRWPVTRHPAPQLRHATTLWWEGLLIQSREPSDRLAIIIPDADESIERVAGLTREKGQGAELARHLVNSGCLVVVMQLVSRDVMPHGHVELTHREYLHRAAFELGMTLTAYELSAVQRLLDLMGKKKNALIGLGEGGRTALFAAALDERIDATIVAGYYGPRDTCWQEPLDRNLFGVYERFADAELAAMVAPRKLWIDPSPKYRVELATRGGAPADWQSPTREAAIAELQRLDNFCSTIGCSTSNIQLLDEPIDDQASIRIIVEELELEPRLAAMEWPPMEEERASSMREARLRRIIAGIDSHSQAVLEECDYARVKYLNIGLERDDLADGSNRVDVKTLDDYTASIERFRTRFDEEVIGRISRSLLPPNARSRLAYHGNGWSGYDVVLDVFPEVMSYGVLLVPEGIAAGEQRPVVVCQHGLEGRPQDTFHGDHYAYHDFAAKLAERGFVVFAPQNPYIGQDRFRALQRKLNPIGKSLFSVITPQHQQLINWLSGLDFVDRSRIAFYGLSYGGKSAMRLPALLPEYCLSICSADFNDWVWKNASTRTPYSYVGTGEYEIFEFDLGHRFNYAEMAALIAPRPFMVERGHFDGVAPDDRVAKEFARVRFLYAARLGIAERCQIEWFVGPHTIHGQGTFDFLHQHLHWPKPAEDVD